MPRTWPDPWPTTDNEVREWKINNGYNFLLERLELPEQLFGKNSYSIDGIALLMITLGTFAEYYGKFQVARKLSSVSGAKKDRLRFRTMLQDFCPSFENRISIPEVARGLKLQNHEILAVAPMLNPMLEKYPVHGLGDRRQVEDDPTFEDFKTWAHDAGFTLPTVLLNKFDYAGLLFSYYRNSVVHEFSVENGREAIDATAGMLGEPDPVFYQNYSDVSGALPIYETMRIGFRPLSVLAWAKESIENARVWAHREDVDIFCS